MAKQTMDEVKSLAEDGIDCIADARFARRPELSFLAILLV